MWKTRSGQLERFDGKVIRIDVELLHEKNPRQSANCQRVEITLRGKGPVARAEACAPDFYAALELAAGKLENRMRRANDRRRVHHGRRTPPSVRVDAAPVDEPPHGADRDGTAGVSSAPEPALDGDAGSLESPIVTDLDEHLPGRIVREKEHPATPDARRPGALRDGAGRPRLLPLPLRRHRPADGRLPPARLRLRPDPPRFPGRSRGTAPRPRDRRCSRERLPATV